MSKPLQIQQLTQCTCSHCEAKCEADARNRLIGRIWGIRERLMNVNIVSFSGDKDSTSVLLTFAEALDGTGRDGPVMMQVEEKLDIRAISRREDGLIRKDGDIAADAECVSVRCLSDKNPDDASFSESSPFRLRSIRLTRIYNFPTLRKLPFHSSIAFILRRPRQKSFYNFFEHIRSLLINGLLWCPYFILEVAI